MGSWGRQEDDDDVNDDYVDDDDNVDDDVDDDNDNDGDTKVKMKDVELGGRDLQLVDQIFQRLEFDR